MPRSKKTKKDIPKNKKEKLQAVKRAMRNINKTMGENVLGFASEQKEWDKISTGIKELDELLGGGFCRGHFNVIWGGSGAGKSSLMYHTVAKAQKDGLVVAFLDLENSFEPERAKQLGVATDELIIGHYSVAEQALDTIKNFAKDGLVDVIILDSIHSLSPKGEQENKGKDKSIEKDTMALLARKLSQFFRMTCNYVFKSNIAVIMVGQTRTNLGGFIALQTLSGGKALRHNSILTVHVRRGTKADAPVQKVKTYFLDPDKKIHKRTKKDNVIGFDAVFTIDKTQSPKTKPEGTKLHLPFIFDTGFIDNRNEENIPIVIEGTDEEKEIIKNKLKEKEK